MSPLFAFFLHPNRARAKKSGLEGPEVRAPALRERDNKQPRDGAAAARRLARVTTQPSCEFVLVWTRSLCLEMPRLGLGK